MINELLFLLLVMLAPPPDTTVVDVNGTEYLEFDDAIVITSSSTTDLEFDDAVVITSSSTTSNDREIQQMYQICYQIQTIQEKHMCIKERYWEVVNQYLEFDDAVVITSSSTTSNEIIELSCNRFDTMCIWKDIGRTIIEGEY